jgi:hypothetical protein
MIAAPLTTAVARDLALVSNKSNELSAITMADLVKICKAETARLPDGKPVTFITRDPGAPEMNVMLEKIYGMNKDAVNALIATANHARTNRPAILVVESDEALVKKVAGTPGAVGLVDVYSINGSVQVLRVNGKLPLEPGYALHGN